MRKSIFYIVPVILASCSFDSKQDFHYKNQLLTNDKLSIDFTSKVEDSLLNLMLKEDYLSYWNPKMPITKQKWNIWKMELFNSDSIAYVFYVDNLFFRFNNVYYHIRGCDSTYIPKFKFYDDDKWRCWGKCYNEHYTCYTQKIIHPNEALELYNAIPVNFMGCLIEKETILDTIIFCHTFEELNNVSKKLDVRMQVIFNGEDIINQSHIPSNYKFSFER
jgi:hypothetical protein